MELGSPSDRLKKGNAILRDLRKEETLKYGCIWRMKDQIVCLSGGKVKNINMNQGIKFPRFKGIVYS